MKIRQRLRKKCKQQRLSLCNDSELSWRKIIAQIFCGRGERLVFLNCVLNMLVYILDPWILFSLLFNVQWATIISWDIWFLKYIWPQSPHLTSLLMWPVVLDNTDAKVCSPVVTLASSPSHRFFNASYIFPCLFSVIQLNVWCLL